MSGQKKYNYWLNAGLYSGLQKLSVLLFGLISTIILTRSLNTYQMGVWSLFLTIAGLVEVIRHGLIKNAIIKYLNSSQSGEHKSILSAALLLNIIITSTIVILLIFSAPILSSVLHAPDLNYIIYIFSAGFIAAIPFYHFEWVQNANSEFKGVFYAYLSRQLFTLLLIGAFIPFDAIDLRSLAYFYCIAIVVGSAVSYNFARKYLTGKLHITRQWLSRLWHFGKYVFGTNISSAVFRSTDQFVVSHFLSPAIVALQGISLRVTNLVDIPSQVLGDILFPKSAQSVRQGNNQRIKFLYEKSVGAALAFVLPTTLFIFLFPNLILALIAGSRYAEAAPYLRLISIAGLFMPFLKQFGTIMDSTGKPKINFLIITLLAAVQLLNCYLLVQRQFLLGAGFALLAAHVIGFIITQSLLHKFYRINFMNCFKHAFDFYPEVFSLVNNRIFTKRHGVRQV